MYFCVPLQTSLRYRVKPSSCILLFKIQVRSAFHFSRFVLLNTILGVGIPTKAASDIFKPFVQADQSMTRRFGGTGLGLSIAQQLAILMGGKIWYVLFHYCEPLTL